MYYYLQWWSRSVCFETFRLTTSLFSIILQMPSWILRNNIIFEKKKKKNSIQLLILEKQFYRFPIEIFDNKAFCLSVIF